MAKQKLKTFLKETLLLLGALAASIILLFYSDAIAYWILGPGSLALSMKIIFLALILTPAYLLIRLIIWIIKKLLKKYN